MIEQDLIISRILAEIYSDDFLSEHLAFRGGTAIHKLYFDPAARYSEDIDLVQIEAGPIGPILKRIGAIVDFFEEDRHINSNPFNNTIKYRFYTTDDPEVRVNLKVEINCREHFSVFGFQQVPFEMENDWFSGHADVVTYSPEELLGTKLRALFQRSKGRDLFDLDYARRNMKIDWEKVVSAYDRYIQKPPTTDQFIQNLKDKSNDPNFAGDLEGLLRQGVEYDQVEAFKWVRKELIERFVQ